MAGDVLSLAAPEGRMTTCGRSVAESLKRTSLTTRPLLKRTRLMMRGSPTVPSSVGGGLRLVIAPNEDCRDGCELFSSYSGICVHDMPVIRTDTGNDRKAAEPTSHRRYA